MKWKVKAFGQKVLSKIPNGERLYFFLQRHFGGFRKFSVLSKVSQGLRLLNALYQVGYTVEGKRTMEIGTGWVPTVPILFYVFGQHSCDSFDISRLLDENLSLKAAQQMSELSQYLLERAPWAREINGVSNRLATLRNIRSLSQLLTTINMRYHAPADARCTGFNTASIDIVFSNTTLEHVPSSQIAEMFREVYRVLVPEGLMVHLIDCSDHFSHNDPSISPINFLRFSEDEWRRYNSKFLFQNRLRASSYRMLAEEAGFDVIFWAPRINQQAIASLSTFPLDKEFANLSPEDICTLSVVMVAKPRK